MMEARWAGFLSGVTHRTFVTTHFLEHEPTRPLRVVRRTIVVPLFFEHSVVNRIFFGLGRAARTGLL